MTASGTTADQVRASDILLVDDDPAGIHVLRHILAGLGELRFATRGADALRTARTSKPDLILLDVEMPDMSGHEVCRALKADPELADVPVIFVTSHGEPDAEVKGFAAGAADFITKPLQAPVVQARVRTQLKLKRLSDELRHQSTTDSLTGLANRRRFDDGLARDWQRAGRNGLALSLLMIDIDHFKRYNDHYGHTAGDEALRQTALVLMRACRRQTDLAARYGGEEFSLLLPDTDASGAWRVAQDLLAGFEALAWAHADSPTAATLTLSIGLATLPAGAGWGIHSSPSVSDARAAEQLVREADRALYQAKASGRARAVAGQWPT